MIIIPFEHIDKPFLVELQPSDWPSIAPAFDIYLSSSFCFPFKALIDGDVVGIGAAIIHADIAWLGHVIVRPDYRGRGIGYKITEYLVAFSKAKCSTIYLIATDMGVPVYEKAGFDVETEYLFYKDVKTEKGFKISSKILLYSKSLREQLVMLDKRVSGEVRETALETYFQTAYVYLSEMQVEGFYLPAFGEGVIIAGSEIAGKELMRLRFQQESIACFPVDNSTATAFLSDLGYQPFKRAKRMRMGAERQWEPNNIYNRSAGNVG